MSALLGLMATSAAHADLITIDADGYAPGTDVSHAFGGVTLSHLSFSSAGMQRNSVYARDCAGAVCNALGTASFGYQTANGNISSNWYSDGSTIGNCLRQTYSFCYNSSIPQALLEVSLDAATDFIQFDSTYGSDWPYVWALDAAGNILSTVTKQVTILQPYGPGTGTTYGHQMVTVTSSLGNIARIVISGGGGYSTVDSITWNGPSAPVANVPEPETLAMMLAGLVGIAVTTRRRRADAAKL